MLIVDKTRRVELRRYTVNTEALRTYVDVIAHMAVFASNVNVRIAYDPPETPIEEHCILWEFPTEYYEFTHEELVSFRYCCVGMDTLIVEPTQDKKVHMSFTKELYAEA